MRRPKKYSIKETMLSAKKDPRLFFTIMGINVLFWVVFFLETSWFSTWVSSNFTVLSAPAQGTFIQKAGIVVLIFAGIVVIPMLLYSAARLYIHHNLLLSKKRGSQITYKRFIFWVKRSFRLLLASAVLMFIWAVAMFGVRQSALEIVTKVTLLPILIILFLWAQAIVFEKKDPIRSAAKKISVFAKRSVGLLIVLLATYVIITLGFYIFGGLWSGSFFKQVFVTTIESQRYISLFRIVYFAATAMVLSLAQMHYFLIMDISEK